MRTILVGLMVMVVAAAAGPAFGGVDGTPCHAKQVRAADARYGNLSGGAIVEDAHGAGAEFGFAVASTAVSLVYTPVRFVYGVVGAAFGGFGGWATGGDMRTAKGIWRPTTEGHYYMRPDYLDGTERFRFNGGVPATAEPAHYEVTAHETEVIREEQPSSLDAAPFNDSQIDDAL